MLKWPDEDPARVKQIKGRKKAELAILKKEFGRMKKSSEDYKKQSERVEKRKPDAIKRKLAKRNAVRAALKSTFNRLLVPNVSLPSPCPSLGILFSATCTFPSIMLCQASWSTGKFSDCTLHGLGFKPDPGPGQADSAFHSEK